MKSNSIICIFTIIIIFYGCDSTNNSTGVYNSNKVSGCTDITACNYDGDATIDDSSCIYDIDVCGKCGGNTILTKDCQIIWNIYCVKIVLIENITQILRRRNIMFRIG